jgi:hypothetical protein
MPTANTTSASGAPTRAKAVRKPASAKAAKAAKATKATKTTSARASVETNYAERAVLIPVGAALMARDTVVSTVTDTLSTYSSGSKAQAQLRRFERRGTTARNRLEREVRKARVRVERELRQRRREIEGTVSDLDERREAIAKRVPELANRVPELADKVQERILSLV